MIAKRHKPPSRIRYEDAHPTISVRVSRQLFNQLRALKRDSGKSVADVLKEAIGAQMRSAKDAHQRGYRKGHLEAEGTYRVDYRCSRCGGTITVTTAEEKRAAAEAMRERGWAHSTCVS